MKRLSDISFDINKLREAATYVYGKYYINPQQRFINLVHRPQDTKWEDQIYGPDVAKYNGRFEDKDKNRIYFESEFTIFNEEFKSTYFYEIWNRMSKYVDGPLGRMRLMKFLPRTCLSLHRDYEVRYHIPVVTNPRSYLMVSDNPNQFPEVFGTLVPELKVHHLSADGSVYVFDSTHYHSAFNLGNTDRIHLLISCGKDSPNVGDGESQNG